MRTLLLLSALVATPAFAGGAATPAERTGKIMARFDTDHDGRISRQEAQAAPRLAAHFDKIDADKDGYLTPAELTAAIENHLKR